MQKSVVRSLLVAGTTLAALLEGSRVHAAPACVGEQAEAQSLRAASRLLESREKFVKCTSDNACPGEIRDECGKLAQELGQQIPSLVFAATAPDGTDTVQVRVTQDGRRVLERLSVSALELDPGSYQFRFESAGLVVSQELVVRDGEQLRRVVVDFRSVVPRNPVPTELPPVESARAPWLAYGLLGVGVAALGVGGVFGFEASSKKNESDPHCDAGNLCDADGVSLRQDAKRAATESTVGFSFGLASAAIGVYLLVTHHGEPRTPPSARFVPVVAPGFAGAQEQWRW